MQWAVLQFTQRQRRKIILWDPVPPGHIFGKHWLQLLQEVLLAPGKVPGLVSSEPSKAEPAPAGIQWSCRNAEKIRMMQQKWEGWRWGIFKINANQCHQLLCHFVSGKAPDLDRDDDLEKPWTLKSVADWGKTFPAAKDILIARPTSEPPGAGPRQGVLVPQRSV